MAFRGCVILLFCLLSGVVYADDVSMTSTPATQEPSTSKITSITQVATSHTILTTEAQTTLDLDATAEASSTKTTTAAPSTKTTTAAPSTKATTAAPSTKATTAAPSTNATTAAPSTNATTAAPSTNATTAAPTTNATTAVPTTAHSNATTAPTAPPTTPPVPKPTVGNYSVMSSDVNSTACLLAKMGIQFSFTTSGNASRQTINLDPNVTKANGICGSGGKDSSLVLTSEKITLQFVFTNVSNKFHLHAFMLSVDFGDGSFFNESNTNLSLWEASVGSSYMCRKEQSFNISDKLTLNTFELQVQPFGVQKNTFSTAEDCAADKSDNFIVPIAVGVALAVLVIIVLVAYLIGRRRSQTAGYQQFS